MSSPTPLRTVRIDDALWQAALARAAQDGTNLSAIMRQALTDYVTDIPSVSGRIHDPQFRSAPVVISDESA